MLIPIGIGVVLLLVVGVVAFRALSGSGGGAESPEAAVQLVMDGMAANDPVAVVAAMNPDEVRVLGELIGTAQDRAADLGFVDASSPYEGAKLTITKLETSQEELADDVIKVNIDDFAMTAELDAGQASDRIQEMAEAGAEGDEVEPSKENVTENDLVVENDEGDEVEPFLVVVERGGGWYVSPMYTAAEYVADLAGMKADFDDIAEPGEPAESPTAAVEQLAEAIGTNDVDAALAVLPTDELAPLRAYRKAIEEEISEALDEDGVSDLEFEVEDLETAEEDLGDSMTKVMVKGFEGNFSSINEDGASSGTFSYDGKCLVVETTDADDYTDTDESCHNKDSLSAFGLDSFFVVTAEERGGHVVSPVATMLEYGRLFIGAVDESMVLTAFGTPELMEPAGTLTVGETFEGKSSPAGLIALDIDLESDTEYVVSFGNKPDDDYWYYQFYQDGEAVYSESAQLTTVDEAGTYRLVVDRDEFGVGEVVVTVSELEVEEFEVPGTAEGSLEAGGVAVYEFVVGEGGETFTVDAQVDTSGYVDIQLDGPGDDYEYLYSGEETGVALSEGTWRLIVAGASDPLDYAISFEESIVSGFDGGGQETVVSVAPGAAATVPLTLKAGDDVSIYGYPDDYDQDIRLVAFTPDAQVLAEANEWTDGSESLDFVAPVDGTYLIEVSTLTGPTDVELSLSIL